MIRCISLIVDLIVFGGHFAATKDSKQMFRPIFQDIGLMMPLLYIQLMLDSKLIRPNADNRFSTMDFGTAVITYACAVPYCT